MDFISQLMSVACRGLTKQDLENILDEDLKK
jgi:hypothetical protein